MLWLLRKQIWQITLKQADGKWMDIGGAGGMVLVAGCGVGAGGDVSEGGGGGGGDVDGEGAGGDEDVAPGIAGESAVGERGLDSADGV
jgi:hypothetical protein